MFAWVYKYPDTERHKLIAAIVQAQMLLLLRLLLPKLLLLPKADTHKEAPF